MSGRQPDSGGPQLRTGLVRVETTRHGRHTVVAAVSGEVDIATAGTLAGALVAAHTPGLVRLVVDASGVTFFGAAGANVLADTDRDCGMSGAELTVVGAPRLMALVLRIAGLEALVSGRSLADLLQEAGDRLPSSPQDRPVEPPRQRYDEREV